MTIDTLGLQCFGKRGRVLRKGRKPTQSFACRRVHGFTADNMPIGMNPISRYGSNERFSNVAVPIGSDFVYAQLAATRRTGRTFGRR